VKHALAVLLVGIAAPMLQGAVNTFVPARFTPDLGLLIVIALGLYWRSAAGGFVIAAVLGFVADLLSGSLLGEQALLHMFAFGVARFASSHLNLRGPLPQAIFVLVFTGVNALGIGLLNTFFAAGGGIDLAILRDLLPHATVNALFAPLLSRGVEALASSLDDEEGGRRPLGLAQRSRPA
jgi:rod shape-determining protein MreD